MEVRTRSCALDLGLGSYSRICCLRGYGSEEPNDTIQSINEQNDYWRVSLMSVLLTLCFNGLNW